MTKVEKEVIEDTFSDQQEAEAKASRKAWRNLLIPAVGSAAFFTGTVLGVIRTHKQHGWPNGAFYLSDYLLMGVPFLILSLGFLEEFSNREDKIFNAE